MRVSLSRWTIIGVMGLSLSIASASGCRSGGGIAGWTPTWPSWSNWGWGNSSSTSLAQNKPSTTVPKPSAGATPQAVASVAAGTSGAGQAYATTPNYSTTTGTYGGYGTQAAAAYQQAGAAGQVQPTVGYQTGPYGMSSNNAAGAYGAASTPAAGAYGTSSYGAANNAAAAYGNSGYRVADQRSAYGAQNASPYSSSAGQTGYAAGGYSTGAYGQQAAAPNYGAAASYPTTSGAASGYGAAGYGTSTPPAAPSAATGAWSGYSQQGPAYDQRSSTEPATTTAPTSTGYESATPAAALPTAYATTQPAAAAQPAPTTAPATATGSYPSVPSSLATDSGSYRPGSTAGGYGVQNAAYSQPAATSQAPGVYGAGGASTYGNTYTR
jgi:hypothetical protein